MGAAPSHKRNVARDGAWFAEAYRREHPRASNEELRLVRRLAASNTGYRLLIRLLGPDGDKCLDCGGSYVAVGGGSCMAPPVPTEPRTAADRAQAARGKAAQRCLEAGMHEVEIPEGMEGMAVDAGGA